MNDTEEQDQDQGAAERKARRLLWWATVLAFVSITVCGLDILIKNQILDAAKESQDWISESRKGLDRLRRDLANGHHEPEPGAAEAGRAAGDAGPAGLGSLDSVPAGTHPDPGADAGG